MVSTYIEETVGYLNEDVVMNMHYKKPELVDVFSRILPNNVILENIKNKPVCSVIVVAKVPLHKLRNLYQYYYSLASFRTKN